MNRNGSPSPGPEMPGRAGADGGAAELLKTEVDRVTTLYVHPTGLPFAVASSYQKWHDLTDEEIIEYLEGMLDAQSRLL